MPDTPRKPSTLHGVEVTDAQKATLEQLGPLNALTARYEKVAHAVARDGTRVRVLIDGSSLIEHE